MRVHYFQRYHSKENVATANTMLLLKRLYSYSPNKFFQFLKSYLGEQFDSELEFNLQEKGTDSVPDATITQSSFKIIVETKLSDWFYSDQLMRHLKSFSDEKYKVLITIAPEPISENKLSEINMQIKKYNAENKTYVVHINTTFVELADKIKEALDKDRDYEIIEIVDDFIDFCNIDNLIPDSWKYLRMQLAGTTFDFNVRESIYYDKVERGFRAHDYLGLYKNKSMRAIGKIIAIITAVEEDGAMKYNCELGNLTDEYKSRILRAIDDGKNYGYDLAHNNQRYFIVDKFYETDFKKSTPRPPMGSRIFDLAKILETDKIPEIDKIADILKTRTWE